MRKFYSIVLMAAALLVGTNAWAEGNFRVGGSTYGTLQKAFNAASNGATIYLDDNESYATHDTLNADKYVILDLQGNTLEYNCADKAKNIAILIQRGRLEIKNGTIQNGSNGANYTVDLIRLNGTTAVIDAKLETPYSQVIVGKDAILKNDVALTVNKQKANVLTICEAAGTNNLANGARIDVLKDAALYATTYGIKVNGNIVPPTNRDNSPYVYIHKDATVSSNETGSGAVAAYSSGYARWRVEGTCEASTGLYAKSGQVEIADGAIVKSNNDQNTTGAIAGGKSGVNAGGSAIVVESNENYPGAISVTVSGNAQIIGNGAYAIQETIVEGDDQQVDLISIQGGTITGGNGGAILVLDETTSEVQVVGGTIDGTIKVKGTDATPVAKTVEEFINGSTTGDEPDYNVVKNTDDPTDAAVEYTVTPNRSKVVTMNAHGYSTFSTNVHRQIKADDAEKLKAYTAQYDGTDVLTLEPAGSIIPKDNGVLLIGEPNASYSLNKIEDNQADLENNDFRAASKWAKRNQSYTFFVLSGELLYKYTGSEMKDNKAYLEVAAPAHNAPARFRFVFAEEDEATAIENVEVEAVKAEKFIENGQLFIRRGENLYNVQGQIVK